MPQAPTDSIAAQLAKDAGFGKHFALQERRCHACRQVVPDESDGVRYYNYLFIRDDGVLFDVSIPDAPLRSMRQRSRPEPPTSGFPVRVYVDGNSWEWNFALNMLRQEVAED